MSRKHAELEQEFLADLEPRTGRSLDAWMASIDAAGLTDRNAIIDWLRPQGLTFAHASWLERIHHNGGRPIYRELWCQPTAGAAPSAASSQPTTQALGPSAGPAIPPRAASPSPPPPTQAPLAPPTPPRQPLHMPSPAPALPPVGPAPGTPATFQAPPPSSDAALADILARGKGLRPLAEMLLRELRQAIPNLQTVPAGELLSLRAPTEFAVLSIGPRELKLGLDPGGRPVAPPFARGRLPGASERITHMLILNDARQVGPPLIEQAAAAALDPSGPR